MRVRLLRRRVVAGLALGLSVLVGFATPLGDAALATPAAFAAAKSSTEGTSVDDTSNADVDTPGNEQSSSDSENQGDENLPSEDPETQTAGEDDAESNSSRALASDEGQLFDNADEGITPMSMPVSGRPYLKFEIKDTAGNLVGGATVTIQGPRSGQNQTNQIRWGSTNYQVTDCTVEGCAGFLDQDSRPGHFAVDRLTTNGGPLSSTARYRLGPPEPITNIPAGYNAWMQPNGTINAVAPQNRRDTATGIYATIDAAGSGTSTGDGGNINTAAVGEWVQETVDGVTNWVHDFTRAAANSGPPVLRANVPLTCEAGYIYGVSAASQLQQLDNSTGTSATRTAIGTALNLVGRDFNSIGVDGTGTMVYGLSRSGTDPADGKVYRFNRTGATTGSWLAISSQTNDISSSGFALIAGGVSLDGTYYAGGFANGNTSGTGYEAGQFRLWGLNATGTGMESKGYLKTRVQGTGYDNGDLAFDAQGNMYVVRSTGSQVMIVRVSASDLATATSTSALDVEVVLDWTSLSAAVNGVAFDARGRLYLGTDTNLYYVTLPKPSGLTQVTVSNYSGTDLASCGYPPTVTLKKDIPNGRAVTGDQFGLEMRYGATLASDNSTLTGGTSLGSGVVQTTGATSGVQPKQVGPIPVTVGQAIQFQETFVQGALRVNYASGYVCELNGAAFSPAISGSTTAGQLTIPNVAAGEQASEIVCTFRNTFLTATKTASPTSGTAVNEGEIVTYTLTFDNTAGLGPAVVNYRDFLGDVLDDAFFVNGSGAATSPQAPHVTVTNGLEYEAGTDWSAANKWINVRGTVPAGQIGTLSFPVKVYPNTHNAEERESSKTTQGYFLRNKLVKGTPTTPPTACEPGMCTEHPVSAWTFEKTSLPADGASLHKGGNAHYRLAATKMNSSADLQTVTFTDDLTHVFKTAGWAPNAAVPGGALPRGIYLFDKDNKTLDPAGAITATQPAPAYDASQVGPPTQDGSGNWILTNTVTMPTNAMRAELWFAVQAGETPVGVPATLGLPNNQPPPTMIDPASGWAFVNYATASGTKSGEELFVANQCDTTTGGEAGWWLADTAIDPRNGASAADPDVPEACQVMHKLSANYFTIRKDAAGAGENLPVLPTVYGSDTTGLWNMIGHEFEIRDDNNGAPSTHQSKYLCRTEYNPGTPGGTSAWTGNFITGGTLDSGLGSPTLAAIKAWNNAQADPDDYLPECAIAYPQQHAGGQTGRWKVENLPEQGAFTGTHDQASGQYWLIETKAPNKQISLNGLLTRDVPGVQLLAEPMPFKVWPLTDGTNWPSIDGQSQDEQARTGRGQLDVSLSGSFGSGPPATGEYVKRCLPGGNVGSRPTACVNPTGYLMIVKDPAPKALPLTGGQLLGVLTVGGALVLLLAFGGTIWWRRRQAASSAPGIEPTVSGGDSL